MDQINLYKPVGATDYDNEKKSSTCGFYFPRAALITFIALGAFAMFVLSIETNKAPTHNLRILPVSEFPTLPPACDDLPFGLTFEKLFAKECQSLVEKEAGQWSEIQNTWNYTEGVPPSCNACFRGECDEVELCRDLSEKDYGVAMDCLREKAPDAFVLENDDPNVRPAEKFCAIVYV